MIRKNTTAAVSLSSAEPLSFGLRIILSKKAIKDKVTRLNRSFIGLVCLKLKFTRFHMNRGKIRLIEGKAKWRHLKIHY
jgi:hypothetical protein